MKAKKKKKTQNCKYKDWERERRNRLNNLFLELNEVLPDYDPAVTRKKCDIIRLAALYIKDLQDKNQRIMEQTDCNGLYANEISQMKNRISDLILRCRQLVELLKNSNIDIPSGLPPECIITNINKPTKWSNRLKPETINEFMKLIKKNKENKKRDDLKKVCEENDKQMKRPKKKVISPKSKSSADSSELTLTNCVSTVNSSVGPENSSFSSSSVSSSSGSVVMPLRELNTAAVIKSKTVKSSTISKSTTVQSNSVSSLILPNQTVKQNLITTTSNLLAAPIMATGIQTVPAVINRNPSLQNLGPGTLILSDGRIVNVPPPSTPTVIATGPTQFIVNRPVNPTPAVFVIPNSNVTQIINGRPATTSAGKSVQRSITQTKLLMPKLHKRDTTKTTFANKVPILASRSRHTSLVMSYKCNNQVGRNKQSVKQHGQSNKSSVAKNNLKNSAKDSVTKFQQQSDKKLNQNSKMTSVNINNEVKPDSNVIDNSSINKSCVTSDDKQIDKNLNDSTSSELNNLNTIGPGSTNNHSIINNSNKNIVKDDKSLPTDQKINDLSSEQCNETQGLMPVSNVAIDNETNITLSNKRAFDEIVGDTTCESTATKKSKSVPSFSEISKDADKTSCGNHDTTNEVVVNDKQSMTIYGETVKLANKCEKYSINALFNQSGENIALHQRDGSNVQNDEREKFVDNVFGDIKNLKDRQLSNPTGKSNDEVAPTVGVFCKLDENNFSDNTDASQEKKTNFVTNKDVLGNKPVQKNDKIVNDSLQSHVVNTFENKSSQCLLSKSIDDNCIKNNEFTTDVDNDSAMTNVGSDIALNNMPSKSNPNSYAVVSRSNVVQNTVVLNTNKNVATEIVNGSIKTTENTSFDCLNLNQNTNLMVDERRAPTNPHLDKVFQPIQNNANSCEPSVKPVNKSNGDLHLNNTAKDQVRRNGNEIHKNKSVLSLNQSKVSEYDCFIGSEQSVIIEDGKCVQKNTNSVLINSKIYKNDSFIPISNVQPINNTNLASCASLSSALHCTKPSNECNASLPLENKDKNLFIPVNNQMNCMDDVRLSIPNTEFSNDLFNSLQVPSGSQHPESLSPTAAFLLAFPLVSTSKTSEMLVDNDNSDSQHASPTILQIGSIEPNELYNNSGAIAPNSTIRPSENIVGGHNAYNGDKNNDKLKESHPSIDSKVKPVHNKNVTGSLEFQDNRYGIDNMCLPTHETYYNNNMNSFNRSIFDYNQTANCTPVCNTSNSNNRNKSILVNNKNPNKIRDKQIQNRDPQHNQKDCLSTLNNMNALNNSSSYLSYDSSRKNHNITNTNNISSSNSNIHNSQALGGSYVLPTNEIIGHNGNKIFENKNTQFTSLQNPSHNTITHQNVKDVPLTSVSDNVGAVNKGYSINSNFNKKRADDTLLNSNGMPTCTFSQPISSACSVPLPSQSYSSYNLFTNCNSNDYPLNKNPTNSFVNKHQPNNSVDIKKCSSSAINAISTSWSVSAINSNVNSSVPFTCNTSTTYSSTYQTVSGNSSMHKSCSTQTSTKSLSNVSATPNASIVSGNNCSSNENNIKTEKSNSFNLLPKFSTNFNFTPSNQHHALGHQDILSYQPIASGSDAYKNDKTTKKSSTSSKNSSAVRPPVNWMTTPDLRPSLHELPPSSIVPDMMFISSQKDIDFTAPNMSNCNNLSQFNITNSQAFYGLDMPLDLPPQFGDIPMNKSTHRTSTVATSNQQTSHHYTWSPSKSSLPLLSHLDNHSLMMPSTLPTLVGDLALGTNTGPSTPATDPNVRHYSIPPPSLSLNSAIGVDDSKSMRFSSSKNMNQSKTSRHEHPVAVQNHPQTNLKAIKISSTAVEPAKEHSSKECNVNNLNIRSNPICTSNGNNNNGEFCHNTKTHQGTNTAGSFLSVSQLVDQVKTEGRNAVTSSSSRKISKQSNSTQNSKNIGNIPIQKHRNTANIQQNYIKKSSQPSSKMSTGSHPHNFNNNNNNAVSNRKSYAVDDINKQDQIVSNFLSSSVGNNQILLNDHMSAPHWHCNNTPSNKDGSQPSSSSYKCGNYSAESLIGMNHDGTGNHDVMPPFSSTSTIHHQFNPTQQQIAHSSHSYQSHQKPFASVESSLLPPSSTVSTLSSPNCTTNIIHSDFHHTLPTNNIVSHQHHVNEFTTNPLGQNGLPHQQSVPSYQNCFNFTSAPQNSSSYSSTNHHGVGVPYITDNADYQIGCLDTSYLFSHPPASQPALPHTSASNNLMSNMFSSAGSKPATSTGIPSVSVAASAVPIVSTSFPITTSVASATHHPTQHGQSVPNGMMNKLVSTSSTTSLTSNSHNKANRKRKDEVTNTNFPSVPPASMTTMHSSSIISTAPTATIYTSSYLHSTPHVSYSKPTVICDSLPSAISSVLNPPMSSGYQAAGVTTCSVTSSAVGCPPLNNINHPSTTTLTNFNLSTIFPEINDKRNNLGNASSYLAREIGKHGFDTGHGNPAIRNHPEYLPSLRSEFNNIIPPQISGPVNPPSLPPRFPGDTFVAPSTFTSAQQNQ